MFKILYKNKKQILFSLLAIEINRSVLSVIKPIFTLSDLLISLKKKTCIEVKQSSTETTFDPVYKQTLNLSNQTSQF